MDRAGVRGLVQGGTLLPRLGVGPGTFVEKEFTNTLLADRGRPIQRRPAECILCIDIGACDNEYFDNLFLSSSYGRMQWRVACWISLLRVDISSTGYKQLNYVLMSLFNRIVQGRSTWKVTFGV